MTLPNTNISKVLTVLSIVLLFCVACSDDLPTSIMQFDKQKWAIAKNKSYTYRKQMVTDLLNNYHWAGVKKEALIQMLGKPDNIEKDSFYYTYQRRSKFLGLTTVTDSIIFEIEPGGTVASIRLSNGGWN